MPPDIRSFFGDKKLTSNQNIEDAEVKGAKKKRSKVRRVVDDSDDDQTPKRSTSQNTLKNKVKTESIQYEEITASDYFASTNGPKTVTACSTQIKPRDSQKLKAENASLCRNVPTTFHSNFIDDDADLEILDKSNVANAALNSDLNSLDKLKDGENTKIADNDEKKNLSKLLDSKIQDSKSSLSGRKDVVRDISPLSELDKNHQFSDVDNSKEISNSVKQKCSKSLRKSRTPPEIKSESTTVQSILDSISTIRAPTPPPKDPNAKWDWKTAQAGGNNGPPLAAGSKEIPEGKENCLSGLNFVFTGLLDTLAREEAQELVKRYGGKVTIAPSRKTSFVVLGNDAGPSKLRKIKELSLKTINEDGLFELIRLMPTNGGDSKEAEKNTIKKNQEMIKIKKEAENMAKEEKRRIEEAEMMRKAKSHGTPITRESVTPSSQLWTTRYAPTSMNQICGNKAAVEKIQSWLKGWPTAHKYGFQRKGQDGLGGYRAIIIHGPPGIGKTTAAHLAAKLTGYDIIESNASDTRSKKLVETGLGDVMDNYSLYGFFAGQNKNVNEQKKKIVLIMDEVDGMSSGDRGGVVALAQMCKKTDIPMILICNDRKLQKMKPFDFVTYDIPFRRPSVDQVRSRIATICHREGLKIPPNVMDALIEGSNKDIRQIINMISAVKLDQSSMDYDQGKAMTKAWEKHIVLKPWDICHKLLSGGLFASSSNATLNDKIELYFNDHEFSYLMIQENYLATKPSSIGDCLGRDAKLKILKITDDAAQSISDGDLVDRMIHGSQQQWSLMPTHAIFSTVRPASFVAGQMAGRSTFTQWLGNNSKMQKLSRYVREIQSHMRLRTSCDKHVIRQQYMPVLWAETIKRLEQEGKECVDEVIDLMDSYYLTKDDFDNIMELGVGPHNSEKINIESQTKATFTRLYNSRTHPLPFMKSSDVIAAAKITKEAPDLEEVFEQEDEKEILVPEQKDDDEIDLKKDKYIKVPKKKSAPAKKVSRKRTKIINDDESDGSEPAKKRKRTKASTGPRKKAK
ncbi:putative subunit of heteropentameric replication factor [Erysiphe necator]|uniref:Replication factor C subunit 1 n=1 Tax=Uncinula necator TaxID=52586 RepID=A0A0B1P2B7_UNCNE|nr:putative subunit of heteropentameric replication factor [Erysiphe necator]